VEYERAYISGVEALEGTIKALGLTIDLRAFFICTESSRPKAYTDASVVIQSIR
jgi:hypothetical protein